MQADFFTQETLHLRLAKFNDPLSKFAEVVDWEQFRPILAQVRHKHDPRKGGRPSMDLVLMFKMIFLRHFYNLSLDQIEFMVHDRLSFRRFLKLDLEDTIPDAKTVWLYEESFTKANILDSVFDELLRQIDAAGYSARGGTIVDASIMETPKRQSEQMLKRRHGVDDDDDLPPSVQRQHDKDGRWTKKNNKTYRGYKNHVGIDNTHKVIRKMSITPANRHDGHELINLLDDTNMNADVYADSAYRSQENSELLERCEYRDAMHRKNKPHKNDQRIAKGNHTKSKVRARVEHIFGFEKRLGNKIMVHCVGLARATLRLTMVNFAYNAHRFGHLIRYKIPLMRGHCA